MKSLIFIASLFFLGTTHAQTQGEVNYTTTINLHANLGDSENSDLLRQMMPEFQKVKSQLLFTPTESIYSNLPEEESNEDVMAQEDGNVQITIEMSSPEEKIYTDVSNGVVIEQRDLMGKKFLITDTLESSDWHVLDEFQFIKGYTCQKAELYQEEDTIKVWFTSQIPISSGPLGLGGLPGLIVAVWMDGGAYQVIATEIIDREIDKKEIQAPKKGKAITDEEFKALEQEKLRELEEQYEGMGEGDGNVIIIGN